MVQDLPAERPEPAVAAQEISLAEKLFVPAERWGWEYAEPARLEVPARLQQKPEWREPSITARPPVPLTRSAQRPPPRLGWRLAVFIPVTLICLLIAVHAAGILVIPLVLGLILFVPMASAGTRQPAVGPHDLRQAEWSKYQQELRLWETAVAQHEHAEVARLAGMPVWYPLSTDAAARRVDIVGGTGDGWAAMLATFGMSALANDDMMLLLDFSQHDVGGGLAELASVPDLAVEWLHLPADLAAIDLLDELDAEACAETIAEAVATLRPVPGNADVRAMHAAFLRTVTSRLDGSLTFARIAAGLRVLQRRYDDTGETTPLAAQELRALHAQVDTVGGSERADGELSFLCEMLELLATGSVTGVNDLRSWHQAQLTVIATDDLNERRKDLIDRVLLQVVLQHLRRRRFGNGHGLLAIAGADHLGAVTLEALTRHARLNGARLILFFEHLRADAVQMLGGSDSAAILMRMGNAQEAAAAAEFIGRAHRFVQSQLTRQVGQTKTVSSGVTGGGQSGLSTTSGQSSGHSHSAGAISRHSSWHSSVTDSRMLTWNETKNWSTASSVTEGETSQRVYEFAVEPTEIQSLPLTAFILVESGHGGRRVTLGDCNPGIVTLDRVSAASRSA